MEYKETQKFTQDKIKVILAIKEQKGLTAESLLNEAKKKTSLLHDMFDWDNNIAADKWRLHQARMIINEIKIIIDTNEYYAFENVSINIEDDTNKSRVYLDRKQILDNDYFRNQIIKKAYEQLIYWKNKYEQYKIKNFDNIIKEINKIKVR